MEGVYKVDICSNTGENRVFVTKKEKSDLKFFLETVDAVMFVFRGLAH